ncbi:non-homologous end joining protein Ku-like isoform X2 [Contarinia nasturtii]|uniref:non-homologous end joining protein Ku-like isoform X2 n=1 Tax=Contarinia nasturtii TaxID=265458 RepID=UPI0012D3C984|nr:non-homologous end joining protein Ku-like isoform X2 [Contarinia nasturtii]
MRKLSHFQFHLNHSVETVKFEIKMKFSLFVALLTVGVCVASPSFPAIPDAPVPAIPDTPVPAIPDAAVPAIPDAPVPAIPDTPVPAIPDAAVPAIPDTPVPAIPGASGGTQGPFCKHSKMVDCYASPGQAA